MGNDLACCNIKQNDKPSEATNLIEHVIIEEDDTDKV
jgi:hypothetical protein